MIYFAGSIKNGDYAYDVASEEGHEFEYDREEAISEATDLNRECLKNNYDYIIIDVTPFAENVKVLANEIANIKNVAKGKVIISARGFSENSLLVQALAKKGITNGFVYSKLLGRAKTELLDAMNEKQDDVVILNDNLLAQLEEEERNKNLEYVEYVKRQKSIVVAGATSHIGTTTQAVQIVKFLISKGFTACYVEANSSRFVKKFAEFNGVDTDAKKNNGNYDDEANGVLHYENVDLYYDLAQVVSLKRLDYDYVVYDFGAYEKFNFNDAFFFDKDIKVFVCGMKANEVSSLQEIINFTKNSDVKYIFSFIAENEKEEIKELMDDRAIDTVFANYTPDMFFFSSANNKLYEDIITNKTKDNQQKEKSFWKKLITK